MHPLLQGRMRPALYLGLWLGIGALLVTLLVLFQPRPIGHAAAFVAPLTLVFASICLSAWWVCRANPLATTPTFRLAASTIGAALQAGAVWVGLAALWAAFLSARLHIGPDRDGMVRDLAVVFAAGVVLYGQSIVVHYFLIAFESARDAERRVMASQVNAREAELRALRAQLNPHFLFNSLNSISALTGHDTEAARRMCQLLGDFLRTSLALG